MRPHVGRRRQNKMADGALDFRGNYRRGTVSEGGSPSPIGASHEIEQERARRSVRRHRRRSGAEPWRMRSDPVALEKRTEDRSGGSRTRAAGARGRNGRDGEEPAGRAPEITRAGKTSGRRKQGARGQGQIRAW